MHDSIQSTLTNVLRGLVAIKLVAVKQDTITQLCRLSVYQSAVVSHLSAGHPGAGLTFNAMM
jgi:hypothetical protein